MANERVSCRDIAAMIDHSLLNPLLTDPELEAGLNMALEYQVASVCIMPFALPRCVAHLKGSPVKASTVVAFPHGDTPIDVKLSETEASLRAGCEEVDVVVNFSKVRSGDWDWIEREVALVTRLIHDAGQKVKWIFENCYLSDEQKVRLCEICADVNADWVKTSTGYGSGGATDHDLELMRRHSPPHVRVKAAGGIRDLAAVLRVRSLGVDRVGASKTKEILDECRERFPSD